MPLESSNWKQKKRSVIEAKAAVDGREVKAGRKDAILLAYVASKMKPKKDTTRKATAKKTGVSERKIRKGKATPEQKKERLGAHVASKRKPKKDTTRKATAKKTGVSERKIR